MNTEKLRIRPGMRLSFVRGGGTSLYWNHRYAYEVSSIDETLTVSSLDIQRQDTKNRVHIHACTCPMLPWGGRMPHQNKRSWTPWLSWHCHSHHGGLRTAGEKRHNINVTYNYRHVTCACTHVCISLYYDTWTIELGMHTCTCMHMYMYTCIKNVHVRAHLSNLNTPWNARNNALAEARIN